MTNSSKQSSLIISITWVNACNHGSNCCSEEGLFSHASLLATKKRPNVKIFALIFLRKIHLCLNNRNSPSLAAWAFETCPKCSKTTECWSAHIGPEMTHEIYGEHEQDWNFVSLLLSEVKGFANGSHFPQ